MIKSFLLRKRASLTPREAANKRRVYVFALCLIVSAFFWFINKLSQETSASFQTTVFFESPPDDLVAASQSDSLVHFTLQTTGLRLITNFLFDRPDTLLLPAEGLPTINRNAQQYHFTTRNQLQDLLAEKYSAWAEVRVVNPDTVFLELVPARQKQLPVKLNANITFAQRFRQYGDIIIEPDSVTVTGPQTIIDTLDHIVTEYWLGADLRQSHSTSLQLIKPPGVKPGNMDAEYVSLHIPVAEFTESSLELPVEVICPDDADTAELRLFPSKVTVRFLVALDDYARLDEQMFQVSIHCPQLPDTGDGRMEVRLDAYPSFIDMPQVTPPFVEYIILE